MTAKQQHDLDLRAANAQAAKDAAAAERNFKKETQKIQQQFEGDQNDKTRKNQYDIALLKGRNERNLFFLRSSEKRRELTEADRLMFDLYKLSQEAAANVEARGGATLGNRMGSGAAQSIPYMAGFAAGGSSLVSGTGKAVARSVAKEGTKSAVRRVGAQVLGNLAGAAAYAPLMSGTWSDYLDRTQAQYSLDEDENLVFNKTPVIERAYKAYAGGLSEAFSEVSGGLITQPLKSVGRRLGFKFGLKSLNTPVGNRIYDRIMLGDVLEESSEEILNNITRPLMTGEPDRLKENFSSDNFWTTIATVAATTGLLRAPDMVVHGTASAMKGLGRLGRSSRIMRAVERQSAANEQQARQQQREQLERQAETALQRIPNDNGLRDAIFAAVNRPSIKEIGAELARLTPSIFAYPFSDGVRSIRPEGADAPVASSPQLIAAATIDYLTATVNKEVLDDYLSSFGESEKISSDITRETVRKAYMGPDGDGETGELVMARVDGGNCHVIAGDLNDSSGAGMVVVEDASGDRRQVAASALDDVRIIPADAYMTMRMEEAMRAENPDAKVQKAQSVIAQAERGGVSPRVAAVVAEDKFGNYYDTGDYITDITGRTGKVVARDYGIYDVEWEDDGTRGSVNAADVTGGKTYGDMMREATGDVLAFDPSSTDQATPAAEDGAAGTPAVTTQEAVREAQQAVDAAQAPAGNVAPAIVNAVQNGVQTVQQDAQAPTGQTAAGGAVPATAQPLQGAGPVAPVAVDPAARQRAEFYAGLPVNSKGEVVEDELTPDRQIRYAEYELGADTPEFVEYLAGQSAAIAEQTGKLSSKTGKSIVEVKRLRELNARRSVIDARLNSLPSTEATVEGQPRIAAQAEDITTVQQPAQIRTASDEALRMSRALAALGVTDETVERQPADVEAAPVPAPRQLAEDDAAALMRRMEELAVEAPILELTPENWYAAFGEDGMVDTPIGKVKMGENQYLKLQAKGRSDQFGMVKPTLNDPDMVVEEISRGNSAVNERDTNLLFIKTFADSSGKKYTHFESVTVSNDKKEVVVSSHIIRPKQLLDKLKAGSVVYIATALDVSGQTSAEYTPHTETGAPSVGKITEISENGNTSGQNIPPVEGAAQPAPVRRADRVRSPTRFRRRLGALGDPVSLRDVILQDIASGLKFAWNDNGVARGLATELGFKGSNSERMIRIGLLSKDGTTVDRYAESLWQDYSTDNRSEFGAGAGPRYNFDNTDARSEIIDVLNSIYSPSQALAAAEELRAEPDGEYSEENIDLMRRYENWRRQIAEGREVGISYRSAEAPGELTASYRPGELQEAFRREMADIAARAKAGGAYLKAPNGEPTRLTPEQWATVRTTAFKRWFGDWEKAAQADYLLGDQYVSTLTGNEFQKDETPLTDKVAAFYEQNYAGQVEREGLGFVELNKRGIKSSMFHGIGSKKSAAFAAVPAIIKNGQIIDSQRNWKQRGYDTFVIAAPVKIGNDGYAGIVVITRKETSNRFYLHDVALQKNLRNGEFKTGQARNPLGDIANVIQNIVTAKKNSSKVVDENGEPLVVYHGSPNTFTEFNSKYMGTSGTSDGQGFYFTDAREYAEAFTSGRNFDTGDGTRGELFETFLNLRRPLSSNKLTITKKELGEIIRRIDELSGEGLEHMFLSNYGDVDMEGLNSVLKYATDFEHENSDNDAELIGGLVNASGSLTDVYGALRDVVGYAGIIAPKADRSTHFVVGLPSQIKSATDNIGEFSAQDDDIRFREARMALTDRSGNYIGDGSWHYEPKVFDFPEYPQISVSVSYSNTTESSYVRYNNTNNGRSITVRFSGHGNNATKFGDQLNGDLTGRDEVLYRLGLKGKNVERVPFPLVPTRMVKKKEVGNYGTTDKTLDEIAAPGIGADISEYNGKVIKGTSLLITGDRVGAEKNRAGQKVTYYDIEEAPPVAFRDAPKRLAEADNTLGSNLALLQKEYDDLIAGRENNATFEQDLSRWRDVKRGAVVDYLDGINRAYGAGVDVVTFDSENPRDLTLSGLMMQAAPEDATFEEIEEKIAEYRRNRPGGFNIPGARIIGMDMSASDHYRDAWRYDRAFVHEAAHMYSDSILSDEDFARAYEEAKDIPFFKVQFTKYSGADAVEKGREVVAYAIGSLANPNRQGGTFRQFMAGEVTARKLAESLINNLPHVKNIVERTLSEFENGKRQQQNAGTDAESGRAGDAGARTGKESERSALDKVVPFSGRRFGSGNLIRAIVDEVGRLSEKYGVPVTVVSDASQIVDANKKVEADKRRARGYYDRRTGEIVVVAPNHRDPADALATFYHEAIGHYGMERVFGEEAYAELRDRIWNSLPEQTQKTLYRQYGAENRQEAVEEYIARLAEGNITPGMLQRIVAAVRNWLRKVLGREVRFTDKDIIWMLWHAGNNLAKATTIKGRADYIANRNRTARRMDDIYGADPRYADGIRHRRAGDKLQETSAARDVEIANDATRPAALDVRDAIENAIRTRGLDTALVDREQLNRIAWDYYKGLSRKDREVFSIWNSASAEEKAALHKFLIDREAKNTDVDMLDLTADFIGNNGVTPELLDDGQLRAVAERYYKSLPAKDKEQFSGISYLVKSERAAVKDFLASKGISTTSNIFHEMNRKLLNNAVAKLSEEDREHLDGLRMGSIVSHVTDFLKQNLREYISRQSIKNIAGFVVEAMPAGRVEDIVKWRARQLASRKFAGLFSDSGMSPLKRSLASLSDREMDEVNRIARQTIVTSVKSFFRQPLDRVVPDATVNKFVDALVDDMSPERKDELVTLFMERAQTEALKKDKGAVRIVEDKKRNGIVFNENSRMQKLVRKLQDSHLPIVQFMDAATKNFGVVISPVNDAYNKFNMLTSRASASVNEFKRNYITPVMSSMLDIMKFSGLTSREVVDYIAFKSAVERHDSGTAAFGDPESKGPVNPNWNYHLAVSSIARVESKVAKGLHRKLIEDSNFLFGRKSFADKLPADLRDKLVDAFGQINTNVKGEAQRAKARAEVIDSLSKVERNTLYGATVDRLWDGLRAANTSTLDTMVSAGILTHDQKELIQSPKWKYYMPLVDWDLAANQMIDPVQEYDFGPYRKESGPTAAVKNLKA
ncbi:MAG: hypothetical protein LBH06_00425 [Rikenellaceae bacterium]|nr:hypothetical protein [Rikenellaceae bacterium]